jgi:hypothetical protein
VYSQEVLDQYYDECYVSAREDISQEKDALKKADANLAAAQKAEKDAAAASVHAA